MADEPRRVQEPTDAQRIDYLKQEIAARDELVSQIKADRDHALALAEERLDAMEALQAAAEDSERRAAAAEWRLRLFERVVEAARALAKRMVPSMQGGMSVPISLIQAFRTADEELQANLSKGP